MIRFELEGVGDWWMVTIGDSPDDIQFTVRSEKTRSETFGSLLDLLELYECARFQKPSASFESDHFRRYQVVETEEGVEITDTLGPFHAVTTWGALEAELEPFLQEVFSSLDERGTADRTDGLDYLNRRLELDVPAMYRHLLDSD